MKRSQGVKGDTDTEVKFGGLAECGDAIWSSAGFLVDLYV